MHRKLAFLLAIALTAGACATTEGNETVSLAEQLEPSATVVNERIQALLDLLTQPVDDRNQLYTRLIDLQLPITIAIERDKVSRITPPPGTGPELDRYVTFLEEILIASEAIDAAIATEDPVALALAVVNIEVASGALAVVLPSTSCPVLAPALTHDLCRQPDLDGYEADLDLEVRRFVASIRPAFRIPGTFGDVIRGRALGALQSEATLVLQNTGARLGALEPGPAHARLHAILLDYFPGAAEAWSRFEADPTGTDPLLYGFIIDSLEARRQATRTALELEYDIVLAANPDSRIVEILGIWFDPPAPPAE